MLARLGAVVGAAAVILGFAAAPAFADATATTLSPLAGATGTVVTVGGSGLSGVSGVSFNGVASASFSGSADGTSVTAVVPASATTGQVVVNLSDGTQVGAPSFTVVPTLTLTSSAASVDYPATVRLTAAMTSGGQPLQGQSVTLQARPRGGSTFSAVKTLTTDANGQAVFTVRPPASTVYQALSQSSTAYGAASSPIVKVLQHPRVRWQLPSTLPILTTVKIKGNVRPAQAGRVVLERHAHDGWHRVTGTDLTNAGNYAFAVRLPKKGKVAYRVRQRPNTHQAGALSPVRVVLGVDRTLRSGMSGPDVTALQKRLRALHYDLGKISGTYDFDTGHAVVAFEKVQRMSRDGVVGPKVWTALAAPRAAHLQHPLRGVAAVEVDLAHQVVYYAVDAKIVRILDSSTGGGYYYTGSDGTTQKAVTPTGHFSVKYKVDGWVKSKLGVLYRPAYFNYDGYAIHGEPEVPSYPASHGCVRITVPAMDRMYAKLFQGMSVWIY